MEQAGAATANTGAVFGPIGGQVSLAECHLVSQRGRTVGSVKGW
jgi:hypothetical protein